MHSEGIYSTVLSLISTDVARDLLSKDPVKFNSSINAHFAGSATYHGRGLNINGSSQIKHAAYLLNLLDFGSAATIADADVRWDSASSTAIVKATRHVRPALFPLFEFAVPTKVVLSFNADESAKHTLYCTQWHDEWPLEQLIQAVPGVSALYNSLLVPLLSMVFLWASNAAFWLHTKLESVKNRYGREAIQVIRQNVQPRLPHSLINGFDAGVHVSEHVGQQSLHIISSISHGPLTLVEELARTTTVVLNLALPHQLQLPYPSVWTDTCRVDQVKSSKVELQVRDTAKKVSEKAFEALQDVSDKVRSTVNLDVEGSQSPKRKVSGSPSSSDRSAEGGKAEQQQQKQEQQSAIQNQTHQPIMDDAATDHKRQAEATLSEEPRHAKVVVGPSHDGSQQPQAKEIDIVTQQVHEHEKPRAESAKQSLYDVLKKDDQLPSSNGNGRGGKKSSHKKKGKNGGRK